jgi:hypothetical protein
MFATVIELEMLVLEEMSRDQLIAALLEQKDRISLDFSREWLEEQSLDGLRLFMKASGGLVHGDLVCMDSFAGRALDMITFACTHCHYSDLLCAGSQQPSLQ